MAVDFYSVDEEQAPAQDQGQGVSFYPAEDAAKFSLQQAFSNPLLGAIFNPLVGQASEGARQQAALDRIPIPQEDLGGFPQMPFVPGATLGETPRPVPYSGLPGAMQFGREQASDLMGSVSEVVSDLYNKSPLPGHIYPGRNIIDTGPLPITEIPGSTELFGAPVRPIDLILGKGTGEGMDVGAGKFISGFTEPGQAAMVPFLAAKPVQAFMGAQALAGVPESLQQIYQAQTPQERGEAIAEAGANIAMGGLMGRALMKGEAPYASGIREAAPSVPSGISGRRGIDLRVSDAAGQISEALLQGNVDDLQYILSGTSLGAEDLGRIASLLPPEQRLAMEAIRSASLRGRSISEAAQEAIATFNRETKTGRTTPQIPSDEDAALQRQEERRTAISPQIPGEIGSAIEAAQQERKLAYAPQERLIEESRQREYPRTGEIRTATETGGGYRAQPTARLEEKASVPLKINDPTGALDEEGHRNLKEAAQAVGLGGEIDLHRDYLVDAQGRSLPNHVALADVPVPDAEGNFVQPGKIRFSARALRETVNQLYEQGFSTDEVKQLLQSYLSEEIQHSFLLKSEAEAYHDSMTPLERYLRAKAYRGGRSFEMSKDWLGAEFLRQDWQMLNDITPAEIAEHKGIKKLTPQALLTIARIIQRMREWYGTKAAGEGRSIMQTTIDRMTKNVEAAGKAIGMDESPFTQATRASIRRTETDEGGKELPELLPGERLVTVQRPDGSTYTASFGDKYWDLGKGRMASIGKPVAGNWSHGILKPDEKIIEREPGRASLRRGKTEEEKTVLPSDLFQTKRKTLRGKTEEIKQPVYNDLSMGHNLGPVALGKMLTDDAGESGRKTVSETRRLTVLQDKRTGQVEMVSTYRDGRRGPVLLDPETGKSQKLTEILPRYRPIASVLLQEPVKDFRQSFDNAADYESRFGKEARRASQPSMAPEPRVEGHQYIPGVYGSPEPITPLEAGSIRDHILSEVGKFDSPEDVKASWDALHEDSKPLVLNAYRKLAEQLEKVNPPDTPAEELLRQLQENIYETHTKSPTKEEFKRGILAQGGPEAGEAIQVQPQAPAVSQPEQGRAAIRRTDPTTDRTPRRRLTVDLIGRVLGEDAAERTDAILRKAAGEAVPKIMSMSRAAGNAVVRFASSAIAAPHMALSMTREVLGDRWKNEGFRNKLGAVLVEDRLRAIRQGFQRQGEVDRALAVNSLVGPDKPFASEAEFQAALRDPEIQAAIQRHKETVQDAAKKYHEEAGGQLAGNGINTGAFVNLEAVFEDNPGMVFAGATKGDYTRPFKRKSIFSKEAKGTAEKYETDYQRLAERMIKGNFEEYTKRKMYDALVESGLAVKLPPGEPRPNIDGKPAVKFQITRRGGAPGQTIIENLWVHSDAAPELRQALNLDGPVRNAALARLASVLNKVQLAGPTDAVWHIANMLSSITGSQGGKNLLTDLVRKIPGPNLIDTLVRVSLSARDVLRSNPEVLQQISELSQIGAVRADRPGAGMTSRLINLLDKSGRLVRDNLYQNLVKRGLVEYSEEGRREFVNQLGQYNPRLMGQIEAWFKEAGFSPFIVAGRNFNRMGLRKVGLDPGVRGATTAMAAKMRAVEAFGVFATLMAIPAVINSMTTGKPQGRPGVAYGAIDTGKDDAQGRHIIIDPAQWIGLRRGMRLTGINALIDGLREGRTSRDIQKQVGKDIIGGILHPWAGPAVQFPVITATGYTTSFYKESKDPGSYWENFKSAVANLNPFIHAWAQKEGKGIGAGIKSAAMSIGKAAGVKTAPLLTAEREVQNLTSKWMEKNLDPKTRHKLEVRQKQEFGESDYKPLRKALEQGDQATAIEEYKKLLAEGKKAKTVFETMRPYSTDKEGFKHWKAFAGLTRAEQQKFISTLSLQELATLNKARKDRAETWKRFIEMMNRVNAMEEGVQAP